MGGAVGDAWNSVTGAAQDLWGDLTGQTAASNAANTAQSVADQNIGLQQQMWEQGRQDLEPWRQAGVNALGQMQNFQMPQWQMGEFEASPDYQFRLDQGTQALNRGAAAGGMRLSGRSLMALQDYGQNTASQEYGNWYGRRMQDYSRVMGEGNDQFNRLAMLAGFGQGANSQAAQVGMNAAGNIMNQNTMAGNASAAAQMQGYYGMNNLIGQGMQGAGMYAILSDARSKNSVEDGDLGLEFVKKLRPVRFKYNGSEDVHDGLIAQELKAALDGKENSMHIDGELQAINYAEVVPVLIKAVQELSAKVENKEAA